MRIPEYYNFNQTQKGYFPLKVDKSSKFQNLTITYKQAAEGVTVKEETYTSNFRYREDIFDYHADNIPAFRTGEYLKTADNYLSKMEFELNFTEFPNSNKHYYTTSWDEINRNLLDNDDFGDELKRSSHLKDDLETLKSTNTGDIAMVDRVYNLVRERMTWNGDNSKYVSTTLGKAYKEGTGNCADINLNLVVLLRELGFDAYPVILSTQDHGIIHPAHPSVSRFNYVIALVESGDESVLLDATDPDAEINILPVRCLNDKGMIVKESGPEWINLMGYKPYTLISTNNMNINEDLSITGSSIDQYQEYASYYQRKAVRSYTDIAEYQQSLEDNEGYYKIKQMEIKGLDTTGAGLRIELEFNHRQYLEATNDIAFFRPAFQPFISENPFKLETREYPVEFNYPYKIQQVYRFSIPENYKISELPESINARTPDGSIKYIYNIQQMGSIVTLNVVFSLDKTLFVPEDYQILKQFYQIIVDKQNELIVLNAA